MDKNNVIEVYDVNSPLAVNNGSITGIVEKIIIGENKTVAYQLIVYVPDRRQMVVNDFEVSPIGEVKKIPVGFSQGKNENKESHEEET